VTRLVTQSEMSERYESHQLGAKEKKGSENKEWRMPLTCIFKNSSLLMSHTAKEQKDCNLQNSAKGW